MQLLLLLTLLLPSLEVMGSPSLRNTRHPEQRPEELTPIHQPQGDLYQHDMMLVTFQNDILQGKARAQASSIYRWAEGPDGYPLVPYQMISPVDTTSVMAGIQNVEEKTCIKFEEKNSSYEAPQLLFKKLDGCWSYVGYVGFVTDYSGGQEVSIGSGCEYMDTVAHEIGHAIGLFHEQSRPTRDTYLKIQLDNVESSYQDQFDKQLESKTNYYSSPYDYTSVMQYGTFFFSQNNLPTILTVNPLDQTLISIENGLTHMDSLLVNRMYSCIDKWMANCSITTDPCQNYGYVGVECECVCPRGTSGTHCENQDKPYYDDVRSTCNQNITTEGVIKNMVLGTETNDKDCMVHITAPSCHKVKLEKIETTIYGGILKVTQTNIYDYIDASSITNSITSGGNEMVILQKNFGNDRWSFNVTFVPGPNCTSDVTTTMKPSNTTVPPMKSTPVPPMNGSTPVPPMNGSTTVPPMISTTPAGPACGYQEIDGKVHWTSPGFAEAKNYPLDFTCDISGNKSVPMLTEYRLNFFSVQRKVNRKCVDKVDITLPFDGQLSLCRPKRSKYTVPMTKYMAVFSSNYRKTRRGFNITVSQRSTSCHMVIDLASSGKTSGVIKSPNFPKRYPRFSNCEYWIKAPTGKKIKLRLTTMKMRNSPGCTKSYVAIDKSGTGWYKQSTSVKRCGRQTATATSTGEMINLVFYGGLKKPSKGFRATYKVV